MKTILRTLSSIAALVAASSAVAEPIGANVTVTPPAGGSFVIKNNAGNAERLRVTEGGEVYLPNLPNTTEAGTVACYDGTTGRLAKCAPSALPSGGSLPWARSNAYPPNGLAIPILVVNTPSSTGVLVTADHAGNYVVNWMVSVQLPLALVSVTCGVYVDNVLVPGSQTQQTFNLSVLAPQPIQGTALVPSTVMAGSVIMPKCESNLLGTIVTSARIVVQEVGDAQLTTTP